MFEVGDRVVLNDETYWKEGFLQPGKVMEISGNHVLVGFDNKFSEDLHNSLGRYKERVYYWIGTKHLISEEKPFKLEDLDKENWWED